MAARKPDPIEQAMESALKPGRFIKYDDAFDFVQGLEAVKTTPTRSSSTSRELWRGCLRSRYEVWLREPRPFPTVKNPLHQMLHRLSTFVVDLSPLLTALVNWTDLRPLRRTMT